MNEVLRWKYHTRELQAAALLKEANEKSDAEVTDHSEQFQRLGILLMAPPITLNQIIEKFHDSNEQFYNQASTARRDTSYKVQT